MTAAGRHWRLLVHSRNGRVSHHVTPTPTHRTTPHTIDHVIHGAEFDELVAGHWLHIEELGASDPDGNPTTDGSSHWWMTVAGAVLEVDVNRDGHPTALTYHPPGTYDDPRPGVTYTGH